MVYKSIKPAPEFDDLIKEYWIIEDKETKSVQKKIIPDGFPEIIFHYGDPYRIRLGKNWQTQSKLLFAGQISKYFYLENTGTSGMIGIKLMPAAAYQLYGISMDEFTDRVLPLEQVITDDFGNFVGKLRFDLSPEEKAHLAEKYLLTMVKSRQLHDAGPVLQAVNIILENKGLIKIRNIIEKLKVSRRQLERKFKTTVGLSPKFYSRIIRFNYIFEVMKEGSTSWIEIALDSGYFDQSHFIKEFKAFTGEDPSRYGFDEQNMANFFLKKEE